MPTLLLRLAGPMQSWGTTSRFDERDTQLEPSKSGVIGLLCAALGRDRQAPVDDLATLRMGVRADREGVRSRDYQTATGVLVAASAKPDWGRTVVSPRYYLADAAFLVALEGPDADALALIDAALRAPHWPLCLGRKAFVPTLPVSLSASREPRWRLRPVSLELALRQAPRIAAAARGHEANPLRLLVEHRSEGAMRHDQPLGPFADRRFGPRFVHTELLHDVPEPTEAEPAPPIGAA